MHTLYELLLCPQHSVWAYSGAVGIGAAWRYCWFRLSPLGRAVWRGRKHEERS